jgi:hypothetical protein
MTAHRNSIISFHQEKISFRITKRAQMILDHLKKRGIPMTARELAQELGFGNDLNSVRPRLTELKEGGRVYELGDVVCPVTGKKVAMFRVKS